jgi:VanZ family protein
MLYFSLDDGTQMNTDNTDEARQVSALKAPVAVSTNQCYRENIDLTRVRCTILSQPHNRLRMLLISWGPPLALMLLIFTFSAQPKPAPPAGAGRVYFSGVMPIFTAYDWEALVKKGAHVAGYGLLAALIMRGLLAQGQTPREAAYFAILLAVSYALTDELHQAFVPGRHASVLDIGFDYVGAAGVCLLARRLVTKHGFAPREAD